MKDINDNKIFNITRNLLTKWILNQFERKPAIDLRGEKNPNNYGQSWLFSKEFSAKEMVIDFIIVKETKLGLAPKARIKFQVPCVDTLLFFFKEIRSTELILVRQHWHPIVFRR